MHRLICLAFYFVDELLLLTNTVFYNEAVGNKLLSFLSGAFHAKRRNIKACCRNSWA